MAKTLRESESTRTESGTLECTNKGELGIERKKVHKTFDKPPACAILTGDCSCYDFDLKSSRNLSFPIYNGYFLLRNETFTSFSS